MAGLKGNVERLREFARSLAGLTTVVAQKVAARTAPALSELVQKGFASGQDPYGVQWEPSVDGQAITLQQSGALAKELFYVAIGKKIRLRLGVAYAKFQVGKRRVAPAQGSVLPTDYAAALSASAGDVIREELGTS